MKDKDSESKKKDTKTVHNSIFSKENVNMGHQPEFDYLKTIGVFDIALCHVYIFFEFCNLFGLVKFLSLILTAGALMVLMGLGMKYSRHQELKYYFFRGFVLLTLAQYFNFLRDCLPNLIAWWITGKKNFISRAMLILRSDILTFAGLAHFLMGFMKKMKLSDKCIMIIGFIMNLIAYPLFKIMKSPNSFLLSQLLGFFVSTDAEAYFPVLSFFVYVAFGYWLGGIYQKISNKDKFHNLILIFLLPIMLIYYYCRNFYNFSILPELGSEENIQLTPASDAISRCIASMVFLAGFYKIDKMLGKTPYFVSHCGKNLTQYYMISFIITIQTEVFLKVIKGDNFTQHWKCSDLFAFMLMFISRILIEINDKYIHFTIIALKNPMRNIVFALIWIITIISVIYIYPKVEVYATQWNDYLIEGKQYT